MWESWRPQKDAEPVESCTIITTDANEAASAFHDRMPVILDTSDYGAWLDTTVEDAARLEPLLRPWERGPMVAVKVSTAVNSPRNDTAECVGPVE